MFSSHHAIIEDLNYLDHGQRLISAGDDGTVRVWPITGDGETTLFKQPLPLIRAIPLGTSGKIVVQDAGGTVWSVGLDGTARQVRAPSDDSIVRLRVSGDAKLVAVGTERGTTTIYRTADWQIVATASSIGRIHTVQFDPLDRDVLVTSDDKRVQVITLAGTPRFPWREIAVDALDVRYAPDGNTIVIVEPDGGAWLLDIARAQWAYVRDHAGDQRLAQFSPDGKWLATTDGSGAVVLRDVAATFAAATQSDRR